MIKLTDDEIHHNITVLRKKKNNVIRINRENDIIEVKIVEIKGNDVKCEILRNISIKTQPKIFLYNALIKKKNLELMIRFASQLGIESCSFIETEYTLLRETNPKYMERLKKIARENSVLSFNKVPVLNKEISFYKAVEKAGDGLNIIFTVSSNAKPLKKILPDKCPDVLKVFIGPEGGFSKKEVEYAGKNGFKSASLGAYRMRSEAATICSISGVRIFYGD